MRVWKLTTNQNKFKNRLKPQKNKNSAAQIKKTLCDGKIAVDIFAWEQ